MNRECLTIVKEQIKESRRCIDRAAWYLKIPSGHELPAGLKKLSAIEALKAIQELSQAAAILLDQYQVTIQKINGKNNGCEKSMHEVNQFTRNHEPVHISVAVMEYLRDIETKMCEKKEEND